MKNRMFVICGNSIEELEADLKGMKAALGMGKRMACGGSSVADVETALKTMKSAVAPNHYTTDLAQGMINAMNKMLNPQEDSCPCCCEDGCGCCEEDEDVFHDLDEALNSEVYDDYIIGRIEEMGDDIYEICVDADLSDKEKYENIVELLNDHLRI
jgi:hypothetical protein